MYAFLASIFNYLNPLLIKFSQEKNTNIIMLVRGIFITYLSFLIIQASNHPDIKIEKDVLYKLIFRGVLIIIRSFIFYWTLNILGISVALILFQSQSIITYILAIIFTGEILTKTRFISICTVVLGLMFILNPHFFKFKDSPSENDLPDYYHLAVLMAFFSAFLKAIVNILLKTMQGNDPMINNLYSSATSLIICGFCFIFTETNFKSDLLTMIYLFLAAIFTFGMQTYNFMAIQLEDVSIVSIFSSLTILYSFLIDVFVFKTIPETGALCGSVLVFISMIILAFPNKK